MTWPDGVISADRVIQVLGEPEVAVGPGRDPLRELAGAAVRELGDLTARVIRPILSPNSSVNHTARRARP